MFFVLAGINHFWQPDFYIPLIPDYLDYKPFLNYLSGGLEILFGFGILVKKYRRWSVLGIIFLLIAFIPSHLYFIKIGACIKGGLCTSLWVAWVRLLIIHPLFIWWAWLSSKD